MAKMKMKPLGDNVIVKRLEADEVTAGGIYLPDSAKEKPKRGTVMAIGSGKLNDQGQRSAMQLKKNGIDPPRREAARPGGQGHARPLRAQRRPREVLRRPHRHQGRRHRRQGDRLSTTATRTWAPRWSRKSPARPPTSPATAPPPRPSTPRPSIDEGLKNITAGANPNQIKRGIDAPSRPSSASSTRMSIPSRASSRSPRSAPAPPTRTRSASIIADRDGQGRQGRRHHRRRGQEPRDRGRARRGHAVRQGLPRPTSSPTRQPWTCEFDKPYILIHEKKISPSRTWSRSSSKIAESGARC
jgi:hypothetical protein